MFSFLDKTIVKIGLVIALLGILVGTYKWWYGEVFEAGVNAQIAKQAKANEEADKAYTSELTEALAENKKLQQNAAKLQQDIDAIKRDYRPIGDLASKSQCKQLGKPTQEWWNGILKNPEEK